MSIVVLVPVLNRPARAKLLVDSLRATSDARLVFLVTHGDRGELNACKRVAKAHAGVDIEVCRFKPDAGDYARKINHGVRVTGEEWIFQGADDLHFHPAWEEAALAAAASSRCRVIGTNDLCNPRVMRGGHSTHSLVHRSYVEEVGTVDEPGLMLHEGYWHNFCDDELVHAAKVRGEFNGCRNSRVEHLHPRCGSVAIDSTYKRGLDDKRFTEDRRHFVERERAVFGKRPTTGRRAR